MNNWQTFCQRHFSFKTPAIRLDLSRVQYPEDYLEKMEPRMQEAFKAMKDLEAGAIANPDENRMVGHYWLRNPELAPEATITNSIHETIAQIEKLTSEVHEGKICGSGGRFENLLVIGIGGSALGPQFVGRALSRAGQDALNVSFFDNTDPDGIDLTLKQLQGKLGQTLAVVISKSGGTPETRNGMLEAHHAYRNAGLEFAKHAIAVTGEGSKLDQVAITENWLARFPMWDWVGGRTSETAAVGLLPAALQGLDFKGILEGAKQMDSLTRCWETQKNPAALLALMWYFLTDGVGSKDMVVLPYKDRLELFSKYLQQLIMESLGKELDLEGNVVNQGIAVYGNKGSTDQHAYVQQLREGLLNFFVVFIEVLKEREGPSIDVEEGISTGDFLQGFYLGTREALFEKGRQSITITIDQVNAEAVGALIALFERAVGFYASLVGINAYHQPGVEAGKKAASSILNFKKELRAFLSERKTESYSVTEIAEALGSANQEELIYKILVAAVSNDAENYKGEQIENPARARFSAK